MLLSYRYAHLAAYIILKQNRENCAHLCAVLNTLRVCTILRSMLLAGAYIKLVQPSLYYDQYLTGRLALIRVDINIDISREMYSVSVSESIPDLEWIRCGDKSTRCYTCMRARMNSCHAANACQKYLLCTVYTARMPLTGLNWRTRSPQTPMPLYTQAAKRSMGEAKRIRLMWERHKVYNLCVTKNSTLDSILNVRWVKVIQKNAIPEESKGGTAITPVLTMLLLQWSS